MNSLSELYNYALAHNIPPDQIPQWIRSLNSSVYGPSAGNGYLGNLNIGTAEQDRADRLAEQARLAQEFRVQTGLGTANLLQTDNERRAAREADPFRFVEFLRGTAGLQNSANPVADLMSSGFSIKPQLPDDPRYDSLIDELASFGRPRRQVDAAASGAKMMIKEPAVLMGAESRQPLATVAENGDEMIQATGKGKVKVTPQKGVSQKLDPRHQDEIINSVMQMATGATMRNLPAPPDLPDTTLPVPPRRAIPTGIFDDFNPSPQPRRDAGPSHPATSPWAVRRNSWSPWSGKPFSLPHFDQAGDWQAAYKAFHPQGQSAQESAAIDRTDWRPFIPQRGAGSGGGQDPSFGDSTDTQGARPAGGAYYNILADGSVQIVANPTYAPNETPGMNYKNVIGADGVVRSVPISEAEAAQLAMKANADRVAYFNSRGAGPGDNTWVNQLRVNAGGRPGSIFPDDPGLGSTDKLYSYEAASPGGVNAPRLHGAGPYAKGGGPHAYTPSQETYLALHPEQRMAGAPSFNGATDMFTYPTYRPAGMAEGGDMVGGGSPYEQNSRVPSLMAQRLGPPPIAGNRWLSTPFGAMPGIGRPPTVRPWDLWDKIGGNTVSSDRARAYFAAAGHSRGAAGGAPAGSSTATGTVTPAQASAMALGKGLQNNPFAPSELVQALNSGQPVNPAWLTQRLRNNIDPNMWQALLSVNQGFGYRPDAVLASAQRYDIPSMNWYR